MFIYELRELGRLVDMIITGFPLADFVINAYKLNGFSIDLVRMPEYRN